MKEAKKGHYMSDLTIIQLLNAVDSFIMTFMVNAGN